MGNADVRPTFPVRDWVLVFLTIPSSFVGFVGALAAVVDIRSNFHNLAEWVLFAWCLSVLPLLAVVSLLTCRAFNWFCVIWGLAIVITPFLLLSTLPAMAWGCLGFGPLAVGVMALRHRRGTV